MGCYFNFSMISKSIYEHLLEIQIPFFFRFSLFKYFLKIERKYFIRKHTNNTKMKVFKMLSKVGNNKIEVFENALD